MIKDLQLKTINTPAELLIDDSLTLTIQEVFSRQVEIYAAVEARNKPVEHSLLQTQSYSRQPNHIYLLQALSQSSLYIYIKNNNNNKKLKLVLQIYRTLDYEQQAWHQWLVAPGHKTS